MFCIRNGEFYTRIIQEWLRFEPGPFCARVQHANHSASEVRSLCQFTTVMCVLWVAEIKYVCMYMCRPVHRPAQCSHRRSESAPEEATLADLSCRKSPALPAAQISAAHDTTLSMGDGNFRPPPTESTPLDRSQKNCC